jgi:plasmid stability protein
MTITIEGRSVELAPEIEQALREAAARHGQAPEEYVRAIVEQVVGGGTLTFPAPSVAGRGTVSPAKRSILEFEGVGAHNPIGRDAQEYVNALRAEDWDHRP